MIRKVVSALILVPLAIVLIVFAVANRHIVVVSFDPFDQAQPALSVSLPQFALILILIIGGVIIGGIAAWLRQGKWRWRARHFEAEAQVLRRELDQLKARSGASEPPSAPVVDAPRLSIPPPV
jgi:uncharacterized integral membrane protein